MADVVVGDLDGLVVAEDGRLAGFPVQQARREHGVVLELAHDPPGQRQLRARVGRRHDDEQVDVDRQLGQVPAGRWRVGPAARVAPGAVDLGAVDEDPAPLGSPSAKSLPSIDDELELVDR